MVEEMRGLRISEHGKDDGGSGLLHPEDRLDQR